MQQHHCEKRHIFFIFVAYLSGCTTPTLTTFDCSVPGELDIWHKGPQPIEIEVPAYPEIMDDGFVWISYSIDEKGTIIDLKALRSEPFVEIPQIVRTIAASMQFSEVNISSESVFTFRKGWYATCAKEVDRAPPNE